MMFLDVLRRRNPTLVEEAIRLHQAGEIPANSYVIDLDTVKDNAATFKSASERLGLQTFAMTKQMGRNSDFCSAVMAGGIGAAVAVDMACARAVIRAEMALGHLGHLVQVPSAEADEAITLAPWYWTVFSMEKASEAALAAQRAGREQRLIARVYGPDDQFYRGHEGGFPVADILTTARRMQGLQGGRFAGITTFPALLFDAAEGKVRPTANLATLARAADALRRGGFGDFSVNAPGTTSSAVLGILADHGVTHCEPGHGLTGTTPLHALEDLPERPAVVYVSEISHLHAGRAYCFGGGLYIDPVFPDYDVKALVSDEPTTDAASLRQVEMPPASAIDYYGMIESDGGRPLREGQSVVFGFRPQAFVTRAYTVGISGLMTRTPVVKGVHDAFGRPTDWPR